ncbi:hypothetical protein ScPMuIL_010063 [Solemya velum]
MAGIRAPKQWCLTKNETINSFENWKQNLQYTLSLDTNFSAFLVHGATWEKKTRTTPLRGFVDDDGVVPEARRRTAQQKCTGAHSIDFTDIKLETNELPEDLFQRDIRSTRQSPANYTSSDDEESDQNFQTDNPPVPVVPDPPDIPIIISTPPVSVPLDCDLHVDDAVDDNDRSFNISPQKSCVPQDCVNARPKRNRKLPKKIDDYVM